MNVNVTLSKALTPRRARANQRGLSMVELMIAMAIGLVITASVLTAYVSASRNFAMDERYARMQENARYALRVLGEDLLMADFWGQTISTDNISTSLAVTAGDCGQAMTLYSADNAFLYNNYHDGAATAHFAPCAAISANRQGSSDVLVIKRVEGTPTAGAFIDVADVDGDGDTTETITTGGGSLQLNTVYLRTNGTTGSLIDDASSANPPTTGWSDWRYIPRAYFVRDFLKTAADGVPALCRLDIDGKNLSELSCLAEGVEDLHVEFGLDTDTDGDANRYTATPTAAEMETVISARVYLLMRSATTVPFYTNSKAFQLGGESVAAANDGYLRNVFTTTVALRNAASRNIFN